MPELVPFRASWFAKDCDWRSFAYVPGVQRPPKLSTGLGCVETDSEEAFFLYQQRFRLPEENMDCVREGVIGLLIPPDRDRVYRHEETLPDGVLGCRQERERWSAEMTSLFLWCRDESGELKNALRFSSPPWREIADPFGCIHQFWRVSDPERIAAIQECVRRNDLFLADGHHRFAAGWQFATVQVSTPELRPFRDARSSLSALERESRAGRLLPPKSTDFYPKLIGRVLLHRF
jgi:uncharacterized protein (DUF1015 family)